MPKDLQMNVMRRNEDAMKKLLAGQKIKPLQLNVTASPNKKAYLESITNA
jgi:hypothetical protein